ncbi:RHS repeat-associated core domain-containing protein [Serratia microhaemolytica]|uniref:RHS repeat-associated core domain-containing protein n=1 Tax=Serratia microhaemolytica TaxID=2675110 RepID=UPI000FDF4B1A|nr:RHS repeat-associated core domain-containing protein [Serratia microhaemolytica]
MSSDFLAAKQGDPLEHSSVLADFISGVVEGALYLGVAVAAAALTVGTAGLAGAAIGFVAAAGAGFAVGGLISKGADWVGGLVDGVLGALFGSGPPDAVITSGSPNVFIKGKPAARAAGAIPHAELYAELERQRKAAEDSVSAWQIADGLLSLAFERITDIGATMLGLAAPRPEPEKKPEQPGFWEQAWQGIVSPVVAEKDPFSTPKSGDVITCTKKHYMPPPLFLAEGSKSVWINSQPACRNGDRSTCEAKIKHSQGSAPVRIGGQSVVVRDIHSGKNAAANFVGQLIGGLGASALHNAIRNGGRAVLACGIRNLRRKIICPLLKEAVSSAVGTAGAAIAGAAVGRALSAVSHPVDAATGAKTLNGDTECDFVLAGRYPLVWQRSYHSRNAHVGVLGRGWTLPFEGTLRLEPAPDLPGEEAVFYTDGAGRELPLGVIPLGARLFYADEGFWLTRSINNLFLIETPHGDYQLFEADPVRIDHLRLARSFDRHDNALLYHYNDAGQVSRIIDNSGSLNVSLHYHPQHPQRLQRVEQHNDEGNRRTLVEYHYNAAAELVQVQDADGHVQRRFAYHPEHHLLTEHQTASGLTARYRWQWLTVPDTLRDDNEAHQQGYVVEHWLIDGEQCLEHYQLDYDLENCTLRVLQAGFGEHLHRWNNQHQITEYRDALGARWQFTWDEKRQLIGATDPQGGEYQFHYDALGNIETCIDPQQQRYHTAWHADWAQPLSRQLPNGSQWYYQYSHLGDLISVIDPDEQITRYDYTPQGDLIRQVDANGNEHHYHYNAQGQLIRQRDCSGYQTQFSYDAWGQLSSHTDASGATTLYQFSPSGLLQSQCQPDGGEIRFHYDASGALIELQDAAGQRTHYQRNVRGQVTEQRDAKGQQVRFDYDPLGRLIRLRNAVGESYQFEYDALHRLTAETTVHGTRKQYHYNALGELIRLIDHPDTRTHHSTSSPNGEPLSPLVTEFERDAIGRLRVKLTAEMRTEYQYDANRVTLTRINRAEWLAAEAEQRPPQVLDKLEFEQDAHGQLIAERNHGGEYRHQYDALGNLLATTLPDGRSLRHLYYGSGHLQQTDLIAGDQRWVLADYQRDQLHREVLRSQGALQRQTQYDLNGRISSHRTRWANASTLSTPLHDKRYRYDITGNLVEQVVNQHDGSEGIALAQRHAEQYQYDPVGQIIAKVQGYERAEYHYDPASNRLSGANSLAMENQISEFNGYRYRYDAFGRLCERQPKNSLIQQHFDYDCEHRLVRVRFQHHPEWSQVEYRYDALGRRTHKILHPVAPQGQQAGEPITITFYWQGMVMCGESRSDKPKNGVLYTYREGSYEPLARIDTFHYQEENGQVHHREEVYYYHNHVNGMPEALSDERGRWIWRGEMSLWGQTLKEQQHGHTVVAQNLKLQGQYLDRETGLHYNLFRYYEPVAGRFTQPDPIGLLGGINLYQYAPNTFNYIDPWGLTGSGLTNGIPNNPGVVRRFMSKAEYNHFMRHGFTFDPTDTRGGVSATSTKIEPVRPDAIKRSTGALGADYYVDINTKDKNVELKGKTKGGIPDWKIKDNIDAENDVIKKGRVRKC